ncbi:hypothetical protein BJX76DRAFT_318069 [Aspergillus varians]
MTATTLFSLPLETLGLICDFLASEDNASVYAFSETNKHCHAASNKVRFQEIHLRVKTRQGLDHDVKKWLNILEKNSAFGSVRYLTVEGRIAPFWENAKTSIPAALLENSYAGNTCEDEFTHLGDRYDHILRGPFYHLGAQEEQSEGAWIPLAGLLAKLTGLRDLAYACERRLPECLLKVLHVHIPRCRLHIKALDPPCLTQEEEEEEDEDESEDEVGIDEYDFALATSSCLSTVVVPVAYDDIYRTNNEEAVRLMARGLAPNLKHVHVVDSGPGFKYRPVTRGLSKDSLLSRKRLIQGIRKEDLGPGQLEGLSLDPANLSRFEEWESTIQFSRLRSLQLWRVRKDMLKEAAKCDFKSLKTLALGISSFRDHYDVSPLDRAVGAFIASLRPLDAIHMSGPFFKKSFRAILCHHGNSLQKLSLYPSENRQVAQFIVTSRSIREIQQHCTKLCDLRLQIKRSAGDDEEQQIYKALGKLPKLQKLWLQLDVYNALRFGNPWQLEICRAREVFMNMAVDAELAQEIFSLIATTSPIESLALDLGMNVPESLLDISQVMKRQWKCFRVSTLCPGENRVIVRELGERSRERRIQVNQSTELREYEGVFRELWPLKTGNWMDDWHSFPLQRTDLVD